MNFNGRSKVSGAFFSSGINPALTREQRFVKRSLDIVVSLICMIVFAPLVVIAAIAIKVEDQGCIFYRSLRVGQNGKLFYMFKLRSMSHFADQASTNCAPDNTHKMRDDKRVTRIGLFLRRSSIDEIPQFWNVLMGDMSIVGPRPELPSIVSQYKSWQFDRFSVPQGITGWWQVTGRSDCLLYTSPSPRDRG